MEKVHTLPKYQTRTYSDIQSSIPTTATCLLLNLRTLSLTRPTTHTAISTFSTSHNSISSQYSQPFTSLAAQKQTQYSMPQIKPYSKNTFRLSPSYFFILLLFLTNLARGLTTLSEETTQRKHTYVTTIFLAKHKQTSRLLTTTKNNRLKVK